MPAAHHTVPHDVDDDHHHVDDHDHQHYDHDDLDDHQHHWAVCNGRSVRLPDLLRLVRQWNLLDSSRRRRGLQPKRTVPILSPLHDSRRLHGCRIALHCHLWLWQSDNTLHLRLSMSRQSSAERRYQA
jgi:hypothetical protein